MDEDFLHLFDESPALRLMRGRLGSFVAGFFFKTFKHWGVVEASEEELVGIEVDGESAFPQLVVQFGKGFGRGEETGVEDENIKLGFERFHVHLLLATKDLNIERRSEFLHFTSPDIKDGFRTDDKTRRHVIIIVASTQPEEPGEALKRLTQTHVIRQDAAETVGGQVGKKLESIDLVRSEIHVVQLRRQLGCDL